MGVHVLVEGLQRLQGLPLALLCALCQNRVLRLKLHVLPLLNNHHRPSFSRFLSRQSLSRQPDPPPPVLCLGECRALPRPCAQTPVLDGVSFDCFPGNLPWPQDHGLPPARPSLSEGGMLFPFLFLMSSSKWRLAHSPFFFFSFSFPPQFLIFSESSVNTKI